MTNLLFPEDISRYMLHATANSSELQTTTGSLRRYEKRSANVARPDGR